MELFQGKGLFIKTTFGSGKAVWKSKQMITYISSILPTFHNIVVPLQSNLQ